MQKCDKAEAEKIMNSSQISQKKGSYMQLLSAKTYMTSTMFCFLVTQSVAVQAMQHIAQMDKKTVLGSLAVITASACGYGVYKVGRNWVDTFNERQNLLINGLDTLQTWREQVEQTAAGMTQNMQQRDRQLSEQWDERINKFNLYSAKFVNIDAQLKNIVEQQTIESDQANRFREELDNFRKTHGTLIKTLDKQLEKQAAKSEEAITSSEAIEIINGIKQNTLLAGRLQKKVEENAMETKNLKAYVADLHESMTVLQLFVEKMPAPKLSLQSSSRSGRREKVQSQQSQKIPIVSNFAEYIAEQDEQSEMSSTPSENSLTSMSSAPSEDPLEVSLKELAAGISDETLDEFLNT
jgi:hypothetical protein